MELSVFLPKDWARAFQSVLSLSSLSDSECLRIANLHILTAIRSSITTKPIEPITAMIVAGSIRDDIDEHVKILAESIIMAAQGDTWKIERYACIRGLFRADIYPQIEKSD